MKKHNWTIKKGTYKIFDIKHEVFTCKDCKIKYTLLLSQKNARKKLLEATDCDEMIKRKAVERLKNEKPRLLKKRPPYKTKQITPPMMAGVLKKVNLKDIEMSIDKIFKEKINGKKRI